jgi:hypothetical protein
MIWLVCGGRHFADPALFDSTMRDFLREYGPPDAILNGGATGADAMAVDWANRFGTGLITVSAEWKRLGKEAGPIRNQRMLDEYKPDLCVAFPGGFGTADMVIKALSAKVETWQVTPLGLVVRLEAKQAPLTST